MGNEWENILTWKSREYPARKRSFILPIASSIHWLDKETYDNDIRCHKRTSMSVKDREVTYPVTTEERPSHGAMESEEEDQLAEYGY